MLDAILNKPTQTRFHVTVDPGRVVLERRDGLPVKVLQPGRHRKARRATYEVIDLRERLDQMATQEITSEDGLTLKVTPVIRKAIADPVAFTGTSVDPAAGVYLAVQVALRAVVAAMDAEEAVASGREAMTQAALAAARIAGSQVGLDVREVVIKDIMAPIELRLAAAELVAVRRRAAVQLEQARAEVAALRARANGAKLLEEHPMLARLRQLEALPPGSTVEFKL